MMTLNDIINIGFRKSGFSGYRADDVDGFVDRVRESYDQLLKTNVSQAEQIDKLRAENQQNIEKLQVLAGKIEEYRTQEDEIKNALISAQKVSDASVREARHKAEIIIKDANLKAERIIAGADEKIVEQKREMERLQQAVSDFRSKLLNTYKEHLTLIDALPVHKAEPAPAPAAAAEPAEPKAQEEAPAQEEAAQEAEPPQPDQPEQEDGMFAARISNFDEEQEQQPGEQE